tara:strand:- start:32 stop:199 length:168 start_codon:yes stop_codon:yes gene_type:complete
MTWDQLLQIKKANLEIAEEERRRKLASCPNCGQAPLDENENGVLNCPIGDFRSSQ